MDKSKHPYQYKWDSDQLLVVEKEFSHTCLQPECTGCASDVKTEDYRYNYPYALADINGWAVSYSTRKDPCGNTIADSAWDYISRGSDRKSNFGGPHYKKGTLNRYNDEYSLGITAWDHTKAHSSRLLIDAS